MKTNSHVGPSIGPKSTALAKNTTLIVDTSLPCIVVPLQNNVFRIEFEDSRFLFVYIICNNISDFIKYLDKGVKYVVRDLEKNPNRDKKHSVIFNA